MYSSGYMAQFVVAAREESKLATVIAEVYPNDHVKLWDGVWVVSDEGVTAQQVTQKLGVTGGPRGNVFVASINGYYGYASKSIWEWLAVKGTPRHGT